MTVKPEQAVAAVLDMIARELVAGNVRRARAYAGDLKAQAKRAAECGIDARVWLRGVEDAEALLEAVVNDDR